MRLKIIKLLLKILGLDITESYSVVDRDKLRKWLYISYKDEGFKNYYTLRKKNIIGLLSTGTGYNNEYWELVGRLKELKALSVNINEEKNRRLSLNKLESIKKKV